MSNFIHKTEICSRLIARSGQNANQYFREWVCRLGTSRGICRCGSSRDLYGYRCKAGSQCLRSCLNVLLANELPAAFTQNDLTVHPDRHSGSPTRVVGDNTVPLYSTGKNMPDQYENVGSLGKLSCATYTPYLSIHRCIGPLIYRFTSLIAVYLFICCARNEARITGSSNASSNNEKFVAETAMTCNDHPALHGYK